jgi:hypothetical protein
MRQPFLVNIQIVTIRGLTMVQVPAATPFSKIFHEKLNDIERRALKIGSNLTAVCREIHISRSTPDRWRRDLPRTIEILEEMDACVSALEKGKGRPSVTP